MTFLISTALPRWLRFILASSFSAMGLPLITAFVFLSMFLSTSVAPLRSRGLNAQVCFVGID